jgi:Bacteriophage tail sheath protein
MAPEFVAPGVYIEELPTGAHPIEGVPTSTAAFVGATAKGPVAGPLVVRSFAEFTAQYGGLTDGMPLGYAVQHYFANGGREAVIARVEGSGGQLTDADLSNPALENEQRGLWLLDQAERFDILCIPPLAPATDVGKATWDAAVAYAGKRRAFVIVDPPAVWANAQAVTAASLAALVSPAANAAVYFPQLRGTDPLQPGQAAVFAPCGAVAGLYARTDQARGVWHSPAGVGADLVGFQGTTVTLAEPELAALDALNVSTIRAQPAPLAWGARTLAPATVAAQYKYVAVRRLALFIEESLDRGLRWAVFEPDTPALWAVVRASVEDFLRVLWRQGALQGTKADEAYLVRLDPAAASQQDTDQGRLAMLVGFAPVRPAEFVLIRLTIIAGTSAA